MPAGHKAGPVRVAPRAVTGHDAARGVEGEDAMDRETLIVEDRDSSVWVTLNRPEKMNAISPRMLQELEELMAELAGRRTLRALVFTGAGRAFCAGVDLKAVHDWIQGDDGLDANGAFLQRLGEVLRKVERFPRPVIAAVNGLALAGGLELVLCCDLVVAAEGARLGDAHANYGLVPGGGSSVRLPRKVGPNRAKQLIFSGDFLPAATLAAWGLVNRVVPDAELPAATAELVERLAGRSPVGLERMKRMVDDGLEQPLDGALSHELALNALHARSEDRNEGLAAFNEKRTPRFTGR